MFIHDLQVYADAASDDREIGVAVYSIETGDQVAVTYDVVASISEYGELILGIQIESQTILPANDKPDVKCNYILAAADGGCTP